MRNSIYSVLYQKSESNVRVGNYRKEVLSLIKKKHSDNELFKIKLISLKRKIISYHWLYINWGCIDNDREFCHVVSPFGPKSVNRCPRSLTNVDSLTLNVFPSHHPAAKRRICSILLLNWREQIIGRRTSFPLCFGRAYNEY